MAQTRIRGLGKLRLIARRYGMGATLPLAMACIVFLLLAVVVAVLHVGPQQGFEIVRDAGVAPSAETREAEPSEELAQGDDAEDEAGTSRVVVHVDGAVGSPGVYEVEGAPARVNDAVEAAGGLLSDADTSTLNLAAELVDGAKVHIPSEGEELPSDVGQATSAEGAVTVESGSTTAAGLININTAEAAELTQLSGVGEATATAIVEDRAQNGPFASVDDLMRVSGIGEKKFAKIKDRICV